MPFGAVLYFDADTEQRLNGLPGDLKALGIPDESLPFRPHISLALWQAEPSEAVRAEIQSFAAESAPLTIQLSAVGLFPTPERVIFLAPLVTLPLLELHRRLHERLARMGIASANYYSPGRWFPHCTVAINTPPEKTPLIVEVLKKREVFFPARLMSLGLLDFPPVRELESFPLAGSGGQAA